MKTKVIRLNGRNTEKAALEASAVLKRGGLVAFPTETVYGLGGNAFDESAAGRIYEAKGRPSDNPLIVHVGRIEDVKPLVTGIPEKAEALMKAFWPGPLTLILKKSGAVPDRTTGGLNTVAIRMPSHSFALAMLRRTGFPVAAPSANRSGRPSTTAASHVVEDLSGRVDLIIDAGDSEIGVESTILDLTGEMPVLLRPGHITKEELFSVIGPVETDPAVEKAAILQKRPDITRPKAPGMKYRHYAPKADMTVISGTEERVTEEIRKRATEKTGILTVEEHLGLYPAGLVVSAGSASDPDSLEHGLFSALRRFDESGVHEILAEDLSVYGDRESVRNRLFKAAGGNVLEV